MAITVKHSKVSLIPDGSDTSVVRPSDWNADHTLVGLGTMAEQDANNVAITGGTISGVSVSGYVPTTRTITAGTGLTGGGDLSANRTIALANTAVTTGTYGTAARTITQTVDQQGRLTNIFDQPIEIANTQVTGLGTASTKDAGVALGVATLDAGGKVPASQIPLQGDLNYQGTWNATTNSPTLTSSVGTQGYYYVVDVAGTTNLNGITDWQVGDWAIFNGSVWQKVDNTDAVTSVNGFVGTVVLTTTNIAEGTNEYFTTAKARASISAGTGISYDNSTGVVTNSAPDQTVSLTAGTGISTSGTYPNFTITNTAPSLGGDVVGPASATDNAIARFDTTTGKLIQNSVTTIDDTGNAAGILSQQFSNGSAVTLAAGKLWYDGSTGSWNAGMGGGNITQQIGEEIFIYGKASAAITEGQLICKTGTVGASGVITFAPSPANLTDNDGIIGVATEDIPHNGFGRITYFGVVRNINTSGSTAGQTWADNDTLWYNPAGGGLLTNVKPTAPNIKFAVATVINAAGGGAGSLQILLQPGTILGGTDSNVQINGATAAQILTYDSGNQYWKNTSLASGTGISTTTNTNGTLTVNNTGVTSLTAGTAISVSASTGGVTVTNTAPDQVVSITGAGTTSVTGTYPNFTVTSNDQYTGTVTSVSALTLGTTGTDLSSTVANSTTTPVITLNVPTASATNRGALSSTDWSTFNSKAPGVTFTTSYVPYGQGTTTLNQSSSFTFASSTLTAPIVSASNGLVVNSNTVSASYSIPSGSSASSVGPMTVASGQTVTIPSGSRWVVL